MKRKDYEKPTMKVVELQHRAELLSGSTDAMRNGYQNGNNDVDDSEKDSVFCAIIFCFLLYNTKSCHFLIS